MVRGSRWRACFPSSPGPPLLFSPCLPHHPPPGTTCLAPQNFDIPADIQEYLVVLDDFIDAEITPLQMKDDNMRFFDHRRENARTDWDNGGQPRDDWEALLGQMRRKADAAGHLRYGLPVEFGGKGGSNVAMAVIREHLASKGLGLFNDLQNESSIVGNFPTVLMFRDYGTPEQKDYYCNA
jgi:acyl-CoA dehydrogenase